ncbi:MAG TPA: hypothetical protein VF516_09730, partial [Kofleriaceae bacterium]
MTSSNPPRIAIRNLSFTTLAVIAWCATPAAAADGDAKAAVASAADGKTTVATAAAPEATTPPDPRDPAAGATTTATAKSEPAAPTVRYPRAVIERPLTLPAGVAMLGADLTSNNDMTAMGGAPIIGYGITDDLEIQVPYAFATREFEAKGSLDFDVGYKLLRGAAGGKLEVIARARTGYNFLTRAANPLMVGVHVQYNITDKLAVISGFPSTQQLSIALSDGGVMGAPRPIDLALPLSAGYQATPLLYFQLDTRLARLGLSNSSSAWIGADTTPVALTAVYNVAHALDVQASIGTDLSSSPGDALSFLVGARYYAGQLGAPPARTIRRAGAPARAASAPARA